MNEIPEKYKEAYEQGVQNIAQSNEKFEKELKEYKALLKENIPQFFHEKIDEIVNSPNHVLITLKIEERKLYIDVEKIFITQYNKIDCIKISYRVYNGIFPNIKIFETDNPYIALAVFYGAEPPKS